jgi:hypothetical protein
VEDRAQVLIARTLNFLPDARPVPLLPAASLTTEEAAREAGHVAPLADAVDLPPTRHVAAPVCRGGLGAPLVDRNRRERLARSPVALRTAASVEAQATKVGPDPVVQSQSGRPGFACGEVLRWMKAGYCRRASPRDILDIRQRGRVSTAFVTTDARKIRLVIYYTVVNEFFEDRIFRVDQLSDLGPSLRRDDCLFKADMQDAY